MAIKFFNVKSKETRVAETEPHISALWASSDRSPNISQGQDFGWRLAPEIVVELEDISRDPIALQTIAATFNIPMDAIGEKDILAYISRKYNAENTPDGIEGDYTEEYEDMVRKARKKSRAAANGEAPQEHVFVGGKAQAVDAEKTTSAE